MSHPVAKLALIILAAAATYLVGIGRVHLWDRDEPRNAQAAREMLRSGDWVVPRLMGEVRTAKPPFSYWAQASAMSLFGDNTFAARLPSVVSMTLTLIVLGVAVGRWADFERAFWTVLVTATAGIVVGWSARTSLTDAHLLLWTTIAQLCLYAISRGRATWPVVITMAAAVGLAGLTKGPVVLGVMAMTLVALAVLRWFERGADAGPIPAMSHEAWTRAVAKLVLGIVIVAGIVLPWLELVERRSPGFVGTSVSHDVIRRSLEPLEQHKGPPGYYALVVWATYFPWSVILPLTVAVALRHWRTDPAVRFALAWVAGPWVMFELVQTKLPHYILPVFPALAYLTADAIVRCLRGEHDDLLTRGTRYVAIGAFAVVVVLIGLAPWLAAGRFDRLPIGAMSAFSAFAVVYALAVLAPFARQGPRRGLITMGVGMMPAMALLWGWYLPSAHFLRLPVCLAEMLIADGAGADKTKPGDVQMIAFKEPSLVFHQGGTAREQSENDFLLNSPPEQWPRWLAIRGDVWARMPDSVKAQLEVVGSCTGVAYAAGGRVWEVFIVRKRQP